MNLSQKFRSWLPCFVFPIAPNYPPKKRTFRELATIVVFALLGYFGTVYIGLIDEGKPTDLRNLLCWDLKSLGVSIFFAFFSCLIVEKR